MVHRLDSPPRVRKWVVVVVALLVVGASCLFSKLTGGEKAEWNPAPVPVRSSK